MGREESGNVECCRGRLIGQETARVGSFLIDIGNHERLDGSGYPKGLRGDPILIESQIVAAADAFDAKIDRPHRCAAAGDPLLVGGSSFLNGIFIQGPATIGSTSSRHLQGHRGMSPAP